MDIHADGMEDLQSESKGQKRRSEETKTEPADDEGKSKRKINFLILFYFFYEIIIRPVKLRLTVSWPSLNTSLRLFEVSTKHHFQC